MRVCAAVPREPLARLSDSEPETPRGWRASPPAPQRRQHSAKAHRSPSRGLPPAFPSGTPSETRQRLVGRRREGVSGWGAAPGTGQQWGAAPEARPAGQAARAAHARPLARVALVPQGPLQAELGPVLPPPCLLAAVCESPAVSGSAPYVKGGGETGPGRLPQTPASRTEHGLGSLRTRPGPCSLSRGQGHGSRLRRERCRLHSKGHLAFHLPPKDLIKPQIALMRNFAGVRELRLPEKPGPLSGGSLSALSSAG